MTDFLILNEGADYLNTHGWPATVYFLLSTKYVASGGGGSSQFAATDTLAGSAPNASGEITGTGYARDSQSVPSSSAGVMDFTQMSWATAAATNWPADVCSIVACTSTDNTGKMLVVWDLQTGGVARNMSGASTTLDVTPSYTL